MSLPPPSDNYIGEPQYPAPWTTKKPREGLRDTDAALIVSLAPDVCKSPSVPIPYPIVDFCGHDENYTKSVRFTSQKAMVLRSNTTHVHGDEPGVGKGVKSGTVGARCHPIEHADQVFAEGSPVIRHLDRCHMNDRNTVGEAIFVRDTKTYEPPKDDDPVPGSLKWPDKPVQLAYDGTDWSKFLPKTEPAPTVPETLPKTPEPAKAPNRIGTLGKALGKGVLIGLAAEFAERLRDQAETQQYVDTAKDFCLDLKVQNDLLAAHAYLHARNNMANSLWSEVPKSNPGRDAAARGIMQHEIDNPGTMASALQGNAKAQAAIEKVAKDAADGKIDTSKAGKCGENVRIDPPKCYILTISFSTPAKGTKKEMQDQLNLQQGALNSKNPCKAATDIANYPNVKAIGEVARPAARRGFIQTNANALKIANPQLSAEQALSMADQAAVGQHAIHTLDMVAGGNPTTFARLGGGSENSSIGSQWGPGGKSKTLSDYAVDQCKNKCPNMQTHLIAI
jgi:Domain of unknown function (DUF4150)/Novel toxin 15